MAVTITASGHEHVSATHGSTLEVTTEDWLTPAGDCIVGVDADSAPADFPAAFVETCRDADAEITAEFSAGSAVASVVGRGDPALTFESSVSAVLRTSTHVDDRTVMVDASAAAADLPRALVDALTDGAPLSVTLAVE